MKENSIKIRTYINVGEKLPLSDYDFSTVLGNITDNAFEALMKIPEIDRKITIEIKDEINKFSLKVKNTYDGNIKEKDGEILTAKEDKKEHGIGLTAVKDTVEKYGGIFKITYDGEIFTVYILIIHD